MGEPPAEDPPRAARGFEVPEDCCPPRPKLASGFGFGLVSAVPPRPKAPNGLGFGAFAVFEPVDGLGFMSPSKGFAGFTSRVD